MTQEQQEIWMGFIRGDKTYRKYYDEFVVLLETGMRVSEFCGLTKSDLDFENRRIPVGSPARPGAGRQILCGENENRMWLSFYSHDGYGVPEP